MDIGVIIGIGNHQSVAGSIDPCPCCHLSHIRNDRQGTAEINPAHQLYATYLACLSQKLGLPLAIDHLLPLHHLRLHYRCCPRNRRTTTANSKHLFQLGTKLPDPSLIPLEKDCCLRLCHFLALLRGRLLDVHQLAEGKVPPAQLRGEAADASDLPQTIFRTKRFNRG